jgi:hypothetical protein
MAGTATQRALSGLLGDEYLLDDATFESTIYAAGELGNQSWGVVPPLPSELPIELVSPRVEDVDAPSWRVPSQPIDRDPTNADAPGRPAMD